MTKRFAATPPDTAETAEKRKSLEHAGRDHRATIAQRRDEARGVRGAAPTRREVVGWRICLAAAPVNGRFRRIGKVQVSERLDQTELDALQGRSF
jgi:hypothetical protein